MQDEESTLTPGGQRVYRHKPRDGQDLFVADTAGKYNREIEWYLDKTFGERSCFVWHETISDIVHIDVYVLLPTQKDNRHILFTSGMSTLPMTMPEELLPKFAHLHRAELSLSLPGDWNIQNRDERFFWPIRLLADLARLPHEYHTWLGYGHSIPNGPDYRPYSENTKLCGAILYDLEELQNCIETDDGESIQLYTVIPVYRREMEFKLKNSADKLLEKLKKKGITDTVDIRRGNVCSLF